MRNVYRCFYLLDVFMHLKNNKYIYFIYKLYFKFFGCQKESMFGFLFFGVDPIPVQSN